MARGQRAAAMERDGGAPALSAPLTLGGIGLRRRRGGDETFLAALFAAVRGPMLAGTGWPPARQQAFLREQFALQTRHYARAFPTLWPGIVEQSGRPIGRLYLWRRPDDIRIVDIALLPEASGRGLGGELLRCVLAEAAAAGRSVSLHVDQTNPAQRLYRRLGFRPEGEAPFPDLLLCWRPTVAATSSPATPDATATAHAESASGSPGSGRPGSG